MQHLDRDVAFVLQVVREVDGGHAAGAEFAGDAIALAQRETPPFVHRHWSAPRTTTVCGGRNARTSANSPFRLTSKGAKVNSVSK